MPATVSLRVNERSFDAGRDAEADTEWIAPAIVRLLRTLVAG